MKGFVYLAIPYAADPKVSFETANICAADLATAGVGVFSPISHSHPIADWVPADLANSHQFWMAVDEPFMFAAWACVVITLDGWEKSRGVAEEIGHFKGQGKPIFYWHQQENVSEILKKLADAYNALD